MKKSKTSVNLTTFIGIIIFCSYGCSGFMDKPPEKNEEYKYAIDYSKWKKVDPDASDTAFKSKFSSAYMFINSICKKYESNKLKVMSENILSGLQDVKKKTHSLKLFNRNALKVEGEGNLDGVEFVFNVITVKRNRCTYDFVFLQQKTDFEKRSALGDFNIFIENIQLE